MSSKSLQKQKFKSVKLKSVNMRNECILKVIRNGFQIRSLKLENCLIVDSLFTAMINHLNLLETLELWKVSLCYSVPSACRSSITSTSLQELRFEYSEWKILEHFAGSSLKIMKIKHHYFQACHPLIHFLAYQSTLESLSLHGNANDTGYFFSWPELVNIPFKLKRLSISASSNPSSEEMDSANSEMMLNFMNMHTNTLEVLKIRAPIPQNVLCFMITKFRRLKELVITTDQLPNHPDFYQRTRPKKSVKNLRIEGPISDVEAIKRLTRYYPKVELIEICNADVYVGHLIEEIVMFLSFTHKYIRELSVARLPSSAIKFRNLRSLTLGYINNIATLLTFLANNPSVKRLNINFMFRSQATNELIAALLESQLQHLSITSEATELPKILEIIRKNPKSLKRLTLISQDTFGSNIFNYVLDECANDSKK